MFVCAIETYAQIYYLCPLHMYIALGPLQNILQTSWRKLCWTIFIFSNFVFICNRWTIFLFSHPSSFYFVMGVHKFFFLLLISSSFFLGIIKLFFSFPSKPFLCFENGWTILFYFSFWEGEKIFNFSPSTSLSFRMGKWLFSSPPSYSS